MWERLPDEVLARCDRLPRKPDPIVLTGSRVELVPLDVDAHVAALHAVSNGAPFTLGDRTGAAYDADELVWRFMKGGPHPDVASMRAYLEPQVAAPDRLILTALDRSTRTPIGVAAYMENHPADLKIELGSIWFGPIAQRTGAVRESIFLMLAHAFELGYRRVEWKCNALNERSRRAALSYGFTFEGIQEAHYIVKGRNRDTAWYRMLDHEWPAVRSAARSRTM
jgi:RimJ/RimL family protein N-acetyltransferase